MPIIVKSCPLCMGEQHQVFDKIIFRGFEVANQICERCGFVFQSPRQTDDELNLFYATEYRQIYQGDEDPTQKDLLIQEGRAAALIEFSKELLPRIDRHLDIGCSTGTLLKTFQQRFDCYPVGVEPGDTYRNYAQSKGFAVFTDITEVKSSGGEPFDLISMAHVLEHIPDPVAYLTELRIHYSTSDGYLLIEVPNLYAHDSFEIAHLSAFSEHTLKQTLKQSGFTVIAGAKHGKPRSKLLPLYLTVLAQSKGAKQNTYVVPEKGVRIKRKYGMLRRRIIQRFLPHKAWIQI